MLSLGLSLCAALSLLALPVRAAETAETSEVSLEEQDLGSGNAAAAPVMTQRHVRFIQGTPKGLFLPEGKLTRAQAAQMVHRLLENPNGGTESVSYGDIPAGAWYAEPVKALRAWGLFDDGEAFRPADVMTRAEFVDLLVRLHPDAAGEARFSDLPADHWAYNQVGAAVSLGWIQGYPDGRFGPEDGLSRAEACAILCRAAERSGDERQARMLLALGLFSDVSPNHWAGCAIAEAAVSHTPSVGGTERWETVDRSGLSFAPGFHADGDRLYYVDRSGRQVMGQPLGAYTVRADGLVTWDTLSYQTPDVPYLSQIDNIYAWVGCEAVAALSGLRAKGFAEDVSLRSFLDALPRSASDPEKGFVGSPYVPDTTKRTRTTIYPARLAEYCNGYCQGQAVCADFRGASVTDLQRELLAGNCVVAYETLWWNAPQYRNYNIEGTVQRLVSNNHAVLACGYDPEKGYFVSDPYNYYNRGQVYQYWVKADVFERIWNERKVGMVLR